MAATRELDVVLYGATGFVGMADRLRAAGQTFDVSRAP